MIGAASRWCAKGGYCCAVSRRIASPGIASSKSSCVRCHSHTRGRSFGLATMGAARPFYGLQVTIVGKLVDMK